MPIYLCLRHSFGKYQGRCRREQTVRPAVWTCHAGRNVNGRGRESSVKLTNDGLSLWYGTPDAPAPGDGGIVPRSGASLVVGVHPANPTNAVRVQFRVDGGVSQIVPGREF